MLRFRMWIAVLAAALLSGAAVVSPPPDDAQELSAAMAEFVEAIAASSSTVQRDPYYAGDLGQAAGASYLTHMLLRTLESQLGQDVDFPLFRVVDFRTREGGDNPDQRYLVAPLRGGERYRIWGRRGTSRRLSFQIYAGLPWAAEGGKTVAVLDDDDLHCDADGSFEILLSADKTPGNWLRNPPEATMVMVRQIVSDWDAEQVGNIHIDRIGLEGRLKPALRSRDLAARLRSAAADLRNTVALWPRFVREHYEQRMPANTLSPPFDPGALGGVSGRWMATGHFEIADDEALILTTRAASADYQGVQLTDLWFSSLEYGNRQTSLTGDQAWRGSDGRYRFVIAGRDPGVQNWLDTTGLRRGVLLLRYDGLHGRQIPRADWPSLQRIKFAELHMILPADTPAFDADARRTAIAARRRAIQRRFGV